jgi:hypothetical protein
MPVTGYFDGIIDGHAVGWAWITGERDSRLTVSVSADGELMATGRADLYREDLRSRGIGDGRYGFRIRIEGAPTDIRCEVDGFVLPDSRLSSQSVEQARFLGSFAHPTHLGLPKLSFGIKNGPMPTRVYQIARRLIESYQAATTHRTKNLGTIWEPIVASQHAELCELLDCGNEEEICRYLFNAASHGISEGFLEGKQGYDVLLRSEEHQASMAALYFDHLVSLAESLGCIPVQCPEQGDWSGNFHYDSDTLVRKIEDAVGIDITPPPGMNGSFGILTHRGVLNFRMIGAIYAAHRLKSMTGTAGSVCEIGAGAGLVAYYANRMGVADYTIIDLPTVNVLQAFLLYSSLPDVSMSLYGEDRVGRGVRVLPPDSLATFLEREFDVVLVQDNLPEFPRDVAIGYIQRIKELKVKSILSINQEAQAIVGGIRQNWVSELFAEVGGFNRILRMRHWLRSGYVEEVYQNAEA